MAPILSPAGGYQRWYPNILNHKTTTSALEVIMKERMDSAVKEHGETFRGLICVKGLEGQGGTGIQVNAF